MKSGERLLMHVTGWGDRLIEKYNDIYLKSCGVMGQGHRATGFRPGSLRCNVVGGQQASCLLAIVPLSTAQY